MISLSSGDSSRYGVPGQQCDVTPVLSRTPTGHGLPEVPEQSDHRGVPLRDHWPFSQRVFGRMFEADQLPVQVMYRIMSLCRLPTISKRACHLFSIDAHIFT